MKILRIMLIAVLLFSRGVSQILVVEGNAGQKEYDLGSLEQIRFSEYDSLSNAALSFHTVTGVKQICLADIDAIELGDDNMQIHHGGLVTTFRQADIDHIDISPVTLPDRRDGARSGSEFMEDILGTTFQQREPYILTEFLNGNIPDILRNFITLTSTFKDANGIDHTVEYDVMTDYLSIGTNDDYCRIPMGPSTAQRIADAYGCILTTRKLCDDIWQHASVHLDPIPYYPVADNNSQVYKFIEHNTDINAAREVAGGEIHELIAGIKKDVVICNGIKTKPGYVAIYGWHYLTGIRIQPLYMGHIDWYVDYSHGIRLLNSIVRVDGEAMSAYGILQDPILYKLLSDETGIMQLPRYRY
ncbi:MAG: hypothetical protein K9N05_03625 [Candidatus Marinimicrobia bacterium]|nr:hypothetical protein [Candidatus Neomarinimicrobiota bacterium]